MSLDDASDFLSNFGHLINSGAFNATNVEEIRPGDILITRRSNLQVVSMHIGMLISTLFRENKEYVVNLLIMQEMCNGRQHKSSIGAVIPVELGVANSCIQGTYLMNDASVRNRIFKLSSVK